MKLPVFDPRNTELMLTLLIAMFALAAQNFLFFHITSEGITIVISVIIYIDYCLVNKNNNCFRLLLGNALLFVALFDIAHLFTYYGMDDTLIQNADAPTQLWVAGRCIQSISILSALFLLNRRCSPLLAHIACAAASTSLLLSILYFKIFPACFLEEGLTRFKIFSEYLFCLLYALAVLYIRQVKNFLNPQSYAGIVTYLIISIFSELCFTLYTELYGPINVLGHILKVLAFIFIYYSLVLQDPVLTPTPAPARPHGKNVTELPPDPEKLNELRNHNIKRVTDWYTQRIERHKKKDR